MEIDPVTVTRTDVTRLVMKKTVVRLVTNTNIIRNSHRSSTRKLRSMMVLEMKHLVSQLGLMYVKTVLYGYRTSFRVYDIFVCIPIGVTLI